MHMCWLGGHFDEEYTPWEYLRRGAKASLSVIRLPSRRKTASVPATSRNPRPRTRNEPCWTTAARSASRCSAAQRGASSVASTRSIGGFPGRTSTLSVEVGDEDDIPISFQPLLLKIKQPFWNGSEPLPGHCRRQQWQIGENRVTGEVLEGHRALQGDRQLQCRQRRAAQVEEVIPPADLVLRDAEYLCPCGGQPVLCRRTRPVVALFGRIEFSGERH